jgi:hypothetical protein
MPMTQKRVVPIDGSTVSHHVMCGRRPHCKKNLTFG